MAIVTEAYRVREDGVELCRTYSDKNMMIERDGIRYSEAIDPVELGRVYTETDEPIEPATDEATEVVEDGTVKALFDFYDVEYE